MISKAEFDEKHVESIRYFHQEKEDVERYVCWEEIQPELNEHYPALLKAHRDLVAAQQAMDMIVEALGVRY